MKKIIKPRRPAGRKPVAALAELHADAVSFGKRIEAQFELDDAARGLLVECVENLSIAMKARERLRKEGLTCSTKTGYMTPHPCVKIAQAASSVAMRALHLMGLDIEAVGDVGHPVEG